jgi:hypothetical protein
VAAEMVMAVGEEWALGRMSVLEEECGGGAER